MNFIPFKDRTLLQRETLVKSLKDHLSAINRGETIFFLKDEQVWSREHTAQLIKEIKEYIGVN